MLLLDNRLTYIPADVRFLPSTDFNGSVFFPGISHVVLPAV